MLGRPVSTSSNWKGKIWEVAHIAKSSLSGDQERTVGNPWGRAVVRGEDQVAAPQ